MIAINTWPLTTAHVEGRSSGHLLQCRQTQVHEGAHRNIRQLEIEQIDRPAGTQTVIQYICNCLYTFHAHPQCPLINAHVEKTGNRIYDCTGLQTTYAHKIDILILIYIPTINISHDVSKQMMSRKEIRMFKAHTHKQCLSHCHTHWGASVTVGHSVQFLIDSSKLHTGTIPLHYESEMKEKYYVNITLHATHCMWRTAVTFMLQYTGVCMIEAHTHNTPSL